jgi:hypothetical protein
MNDAPKPRVGLCEGEGHDWRHPVPVTLRKGLDPNMPKAGHRALTTVVLDDDGKHVGQISVLAGCAVQIAVESPDGSARAIYYLNPTDLFEAVSADHKAGQPGTVLPTVAVPVPEPPKVADAVVPDGSVEYRIMGDAGNGLIAAFTEPSTDLETVKARMTQIKNAIWLQVRHVGPWVDHDEPMVTTSKETDHG